ncbi:DUF72 domain-containing protein [Priestia taiwanensis]|uniref:DUF72 domain-containing protein n=1 Tax=Priestia taiwanensis TaxID=1347902 RepID=UPI00196479BB|nr:DUF72 domain-containing protein [Priestia taiwanensis]MBM7363952.1 uncharacterized protein YecE (DUF72 family) [Priestia taiwanensis]
MVIKIGVTGWGDHDSLYPDTYTNKNKLKTYSNHFPIVEVDSAFYAVQSERNYAKWVQETPSHFSFVVKALGTLTGHTREGIKAAELDALFDRYLSSVEPVREAGKLKALGTLTGHTREGIKAAELDALFDRYLSSVEPVREAGKLKALLFQFPPWFDCKAENVHYLRYIKAKLGNIPAAIEFRNQTWFRDNYRERTLSFMEEEEWIHTICDEPQAGAGSIPTILHPTHKNLTLVRFHGRNVHGWNNHGQDNWRKVRFLYRYTKEELVEWVNHIRELEKKTKEICILFNNNSGGDAVHNAKQLMGLLNIEYGEKMPEQMELF